VEADVDALGGRHDVAVTHAGGEQTLDPVDLDAVPPASDVVVMSTSVWRYCPPAFPDD
jgi:hypothetical protein